MRSNENLVVAKWESADWVSVGCCTNCRSERALADAGLLLLTTTTATGNLGALMHARLIRLLWYFRGQLWILGSEIMTSLLHSLKCSIHVTMSHKFVANVLGIRTTLLFEQAIPNLYYSWIVSRPSISCYQDKRCVHYGSYEISSEKKLYCTFQLFTTMRQILHFCFFTEQKL